MRNGFCVFDSRGLDRDRMGDGLEEVAEWMEKGVRHRQPCRGASLLDASAPAKRFVRRRVNCVILVANLRELHRSLLSGDAGPLEATYDLVHHPPIKINSSISSNTQLSHSRAAEKPILVLTHGDELSPEERMEARVKVCEHLGVPDTNGVYDIPCVNEYGAAVDEMDPTTAYAVAEIILRALMVADRSRRPKARIKDRLLLVLAWAMCALSAWFAFLSRCCAKLGRANREAKLRVQ
ncbi:hypothetical protein BHE74_00027145 [Ensete ventricosum]|nr:hypothetical protein GW17_00017410 [Ensete ventricosum]RWW65545.1 hypothetical protein BHE74_00027145 [Ensete ventricosum]RZS04398.1 hypothetical protein BHM03_00034730 [Ensete ventricosum]